MAKSINVLPLLWIAAWISVSFCFRQNPHFPSGLCAPLLGFIAILKNGWSGNALHEITLPWIVFWLGLSMAAALRLCAKKNV
jgi:hypothetical protein